MSSLYFDELFKISVFSMRMNRAHPDVRRDKIWSLQFAFMHGIFTLVFGLLLHTIFHNIKNNDFPQACANGILSVFYIVVTFKYCMMLLHQSTIKNLIDAMKNGFRLAESLPGEEKILLLEYANRGKWVTKLWLIIASGTAALFPIKSIILMVYYTIVDEFKFVPIYDLTYPTVVEKVKYNLVPLIIINLLMLFYAVYASCMYIALVPLGPVFMLYACGQLEILKNRILRLFPESDYNPEETSTKLKDIIKAMEVIYSFTDDIKKCFQLVYELTLKGTIVTLPITLYQVKETFHNGQLSLEFITVIFACIALTSCPCYYSDLLMETGESLRQAVYSSGWERHWDRRARSILLVVLTRTARPVAIRSLFQNLCLNALTGVYQQAYTIFNVLNAALK